MLKVEHLSKRYSKTKLAVDDLSFTVENGELCGFIGHNGAGKTTTLRVITGIMDYDDGVITINGNDISKNSKEAKMVTAFLPDNPDIYEYLTGIQYLTFISDVFKIPAHERMPLIKKYADSFKITDVLGNPVGSYSHGMKQKLALVSAFIRNPKLLILDEPFVGLDPEGAHTMKTHLREICDGGGAVLFSSHVLEVVERLCDKLVIIKGGKLIESGKTSDILGNKSLENVFLELEDGPDAAAKAADEAVTPDAEA